MKKLLLALFCAVPFLAAAQEPVISGDTMLCPYTNGTASVQGDVVYDSYQWYWKYWFDEDFVEIEGANEATFTYDWYTYDQAVFKVAVTQGGSTYESNTIQIDSHAWSPMSVIGEMGDPANVTFDPDAQTFLLCEGTTFPNTVNSPYTENIQWYKDDEPIEGATSATYEIYEAGTYYVRASPFVCPDQPENAAQSLPLTVVMKADCNLGVNYPEANNVSLYPNPVQSVLNVQLSNSNMFTSYVIFDITGKTLLQGSIDASPVINVSTLAAGTYIIKLAGDTATVNKKFIKE